MTKKDIKALKRKAAATYKSGDKKEAYRLWEQATKERLALQGKV